MTRVVEITDGSINKTTLAYFHQWVSVSHYGEREQVIHDVQALVEFPDGRVEKINTNNLRFVYRPITTKGE